METAHPFYTLRQQGLVRVGACTPAATSGDPAENAAEAIRNAEDAHAKGIDLLVYPELNLTSYAIDDLHLQDGYLGAVEQGLAELVAASEHLRPVLCVGAALVRNGRLYNCALAVHRGRILGAVPKSFLPNYREYYEKRWFALGSGVTGLEMELCGQTVPFGTDLVFAASDYADFTFHMEICEDYWSPVQPSTEGALAGALILCNLSASDITIGKSRERKMLCAASSSRNMAAYIYSASGPGESTTDLAWDGQGLIYELGEELAESTRFQWNAETVYADVDAARLRQERMRTGTFNDAARHLDHPETRFRRIAFAHGDLGEDRGLVRAIRRYPYVPNAPERLDEDCYEAFNIQVEGLAKRIRAAHAKCVTIGISGGIDSTHALIVAAKAMDRLDRPRTDIRGYTLPGFATGEDTRGNAWALMKAIGCTAEEIDIRPAARQMLGDMGHPFADGEPQYDVTFENVQAGLRTDYLFRLAGQHGGFVIGTGDMSELALGWCTYGVGDHMSHYGVNGGVPKTLIQYLIRWSERTNQFDAATDEVLERILATEISPELVPADAETGAMQSTEDRIGPYALHDFFLYWTLRHGLAPSKIAFLAWHAWHDRNAGMWPIGHADDNRPEYDLATIEKWLRVFLQRYFGFAQFKRSALPNGPKVSGGGALSPRGDWRAPSDGTPAAWLAELDANLPR
ncbi:NAD(+) synthase [Pacificimonas sp. WHA3]|uniref:Glutamine-dependent NAD(+) synthetase n=1 Tax=Pacificimonas pallii TaxID=2827236 RepID=A0ABS6SCM3_9SPHN|nr:NAD(+) synthase [Pacificimonas pallii]MBV7256071.1 NAD(+) synthase [Pacificimonas pallii]